MNTLLVSTILLLAKSHATSAFVPPSISTHQQVSSSPTPTLLHAYIPDGLTPEEYASIKAADKKKLGHNLGRLGPRGFQSRSMQAWQEAYDEGTAGHTFAPIQYKQKLRSGELRREEVPYMVRKNGKWDNSDVKGAKKLPWSKKDKEYAAGGFKKEQSVSILGSGPAGKARS